MIFEKLNVLVFLNKMGVDITNRSKYLLAHLFWPEIKVLCKFAQVFAQVFIQSIKHRRQKRQYYNTYSLNHF